MSYSALPVGPLEQAERLEQLRALENGYPIRVVETEYESWAWIRRRIWKGCRGCSRHAIWPRGGCTEEARMAKYIFVTGGVVSSLGKGIAAASIGCLLESRG